MKDIGAVLFWGLMFITTPSVYGAEHLALPSDCLEVRAEQSRLNLLGSNILNAKTTRTPGGGEYKPFENIACEKGSCKFTRAQNPLLKYEPHHLDANENGYVAYPNIDIKAQQLAFDTTVTKLKLLAESGICGTQITVNKSPAGDGDSSFIIRYFLKDLVAKEDIFNLSEGRVVSWGRINSSGEMATLNLNR